MKKLIMGLACLAFVGILTLGCQEETEEPELLLDEITEAEIERQEVADFESISMAANVAEIRFENGEYILSFYDGTNDHVVAVTYFDDSSLIQYRISDGGNSYRVEMDVSKEMISIESVGSFDFNLDISSNENILKNITAVITLHHVLNTGSSYSFVNNGLSDSAVLCLSGSAYS